MRSDLIEVQDAADAGDGSAGPCSPARPGRCCPQHNACPPYGRAGGRRP